MNAPAPVSKSAPGSRLRRAAPAEAGAARAAAASKTTKAAIRVLIVDDSLTVRTIFKRMVESDGAMNVVETSSSAERAIAQLDKTGVDVVLLDLEMPGMGGLEALPTILERARGGQVLVVSSLTQDGAEHTISALSMGAADTMLKPRPGGFNEDYRSQLLGKIRALGENQPGGDPGEHADEQADESPLVSQQSDKGTGTGTQPLAAKPHAAQLKQAERADTPSATALRPVPKTSPEVIAI
ncbi:MAG: response regulator, partial [Pseudomonadota bacterium]